MRALPLYLLVAVLAAAPLAAQQETQRVVRGLSFEGNHAIDNYTLSTAIATTRSGAFASRWWLRWMGLGEKRYFNELEFRRDVVRLVLLYRQSGYMNAVVDTLVRREDGDAYVTFRIYEGDPVRLARLDVVGAGIDSVFNVATLKRSLPLQVGDPFNRALFQASADTIVSRLRNRGFPFADILRSFDVDAAELRASATLEAVPGPRMRIGEVVITGANQTDTVTVRHMLSVKAGDWFRQEQLYQTQRDLYGLGLFRSVSVALADTAPRIGGRGVGDRGGGDSTVGVVVRVADAPRHRIRVGGGYGSLDCFRVQSGWTAYDFLGGARSLDVTGQLSKLGVGVPTDAGFKNNVCRVLQTDSTSDTLNYNATVTLRQPAFLSPRHTASLAVFAERRSEYKAYTRQAVGTN
ncbi:MAG TPA: POTRA domain-containing protein, partial [Gemmatimonadales bacterium]|nr:POTRA domain-containing protein [Gemmatimonadales bacterium]